MSDENAILFQKAERKKAKLRLAICGPSGSGKTYSALKIAQGLGGKIVLLDTEHGSGELYANMLDYDVARISPPYTPKKYIALISEAEKAGYDVIIIDSLTHAWAGEGGVLQMHDKAAAASSSKNSFAAWRSVTPEHNALVDAMLSTGVHLIATMRTKTAYSMTDDKGKTKPVKIGMAPVQREGMDYEFTVVFDLSVDGHVATTSKDRTSLFDGKFFVPSEETGQELLGWLDSGIDMDKLHDEAAKKLITRIEKIDNGFELRAWWKKHKSEIEGLPKAKRDKVVAAKDAKKDKLDKEAAKNAKGTSIAEEKKGAEQDSAKSDDDKLYNKLLENAGEVLKAAHKANLLQDENGELLTMPGYILHYHKKDKLKSMNADQLGNLIAELS